jgi:hypothetical protein
MGLAQGTLVQVEQPAALHTLTAQDTGFEMVVGAIGRDVLTPENPLWGK